MPENTKFIQINRVLTEKDSKMNTHVSPESINVNRIAGFRKWIKGGNDIKISGEMTLLLIRKISDIDSSQKPSSMLIQESYESFKARLGKAVVDDND